MALDRIYYAIGDVHGEYEKLRELHSVINAYHAKKFGERERTIVHLGDYVDRGAGSRKVIEFLIDQQSEPGRSIVSLRGNHEAMLIEVYRTARRSAAENWLKNGGQQTLESYCASTAADLPLDHISWMESLKTKFVTEGGRLVFVHAGIDPEAYPECHEATHIWTRTAKFFESHTWKNPSLDDVCVVHGHTPTLNAQPYITPDRRRINVDTGACYGGALTAAIFMGSEIFNTLQVT